MFRLGDVRVMAAGLALGAAGDLLAAAAILADAPYRLLCLPLGLMGLTKGRSA